MSDIKQEVKLPLQYAQIAELLPHRYPFLLIDAVIAYEAKKSLRAIKNVTFNEPFFQGHFPNNPVMPGVLVIEALAQASGMLTGLSEYAGVSNPPLFYLVRIDDARFSKKVLPGDQLHLQVEITRKLRKMRQFACRAFVQDQVVASANLLCAEGGE